MALDQIGQKLKAARESQGLTLIQIYERTKIPLHHLQSIDTGTTDDLPEAVYVAGFIKRYAEVVGLNGQALSEEYRREAADEHSGNGNGGGFLPRPAKISSSPVVVVPAPYMGKTRLESGPPNVMRMMFFPAISIIMVIGLLAVLLQWHSNSNANQPDSSILSLKDATAKYNQVQPTTTNVPGVSGGPTQPGVPGQPVTQPTPADSTFSIIASKHVWVEITALSTGQTEYTGFLERGDRRDYKDAQGIRIHTGSAGSLTIDSNGKSEVLGLPGKPADRVFLAKGVTSATPGAVAPGTPGATGSGSILGAPGTTPGVKPPVKRPVRKPTDATATKAHRYRSIDEAPSRQYMPGESLGGHRSIDVPYRYTEGRLDQE